MSRPMLVATVEGTSIFFVYRRCQPSGNIPGTYLRTQFFWVSFDAMGNQVLSSASPFCFSEWPVRQHSASVLAEIPVLSAAEGSSFRINGVFVVISSNITCLNCERSWLWAWMQMSGWVGKVKIKGPCLRSVIFLLHLGFYWGGIGVAIVDEAASASVFSTEVFRKSGGVSGHVFRESWQYRCTFWWSWWRSWLILCGFDGMYRIKSSKECPEHLRSIWRSVFGAQWIFISRWLQICSSRLFEEYSPWARDTLWKDMRVLLSLH